jgi:hypothetical protein
LANKNSTVPNYVAFMKNFVLGCVYCSVLLLHTMIIHGQDSSSSCKVRLQTLGAAYRGACKNGLADGQGEAVGLHRYKGSFKRGVPNGYGVYYYDDSTYYAGYFLEGLKEGKGETHYTRKGKTDSTISGYWSGNEFCGKKYITYTFDGGSKFDRYDISPSAESGRSILFEISTTSGSPTGVPTDLQGKPGYVLRLDELNAGNNIILRLLSSVDTPTRTFVTYDISAFPAIIYGTLSNGDSFKLHLFKSAKWTVRLFVNR